MLDWGCIACLIGSVDCRVDWGCGTCWSACLIGGVTCWIACLIGVWTCLIFAQPTSAGSNCTKCTRSVEENLGPSCHTYCSAQKNPAGMCCTSNICSCKRVCDKKKDGPVGLWHIPCLYPIFGVIKMRHLEVLWREISCDSYVVDLIVIRMWATLTEMGT